MCIVCPSSKLGKRERIDELFNNIEIWIHSNAMNNMIELFGGTVPKEYTFVQFVQWLNKFVEVWNYRSRNVLNTENERWNVFDDIFVKRHKEEIMDCASELGLVQESYPNMEPDFILPLGGARYSNLDRPVYAANIHKKIRSINADKKIKIVALSGTRPINDKERVAINSYAPEAGTEFDAINKGLEMAFELDGKYEQSGHFDDNINLCSMIRRYTYNQKNTEIFSLAAPSSDFTRRANSRDTFEYFLKYFNIKKEDNILLVTSQIYVPYQLLKFVDLAIEGNFNVECVGYSMAEKEALAKPSNFLQELKGTVNAINLLVEKYALSLNYSR